MVRFVSRIASDSLSILLSICLTILTNFGFDLTYYVCYCEARLASIYFVDLVRDDLGVCVCGRVVSVGDWLGWTS